MQLYVTQYQGKTNVGSLSIRCPACKQIGTFEGLEQDLAFLSKAQPIVVGHRVCPSRSCRAHLFVVVTVEGNLETTYPPERIDFDSTKIPAPIIQSLEEAITCHANQCFIAAAIMVRKTLELLCIDQGTTGANLKERITALGTKVLLPQELLVGLDDIRLLGNDAAHVESEAYAKVSQEELDVAIEFTKEVLKGVYQYSTLLAKIRALKKVPPSH